MTDEAHAAEAEAYGLPAPGYRLPADTHPGRVRLQVSDLERSLEYYRRVLGLRVLRQVDGHASLGAGDDEVAIIELHERPGARPVPRNGRLGLFHYALLLPDRPSLGRFVRHLSEIGARAGASDHLVSEALYLQDPDGLGIEVYADRPRSVWRHRARQLVMSTEPLDVDDLAHAAGDVPWQGMPPGTVLGHVHLHVGDIPTAQAFYHEALGLDRVVWSYPGALFLSAGGYHHHLGVNTWAAGAPSPEDADARLLDWELVLPSSDDVRQALESLAAAGNEIEPTPDGGLVRDPWGTAMRLRTG